MNGRTFATALWADSWEKTLHAEDACVQGDVSFDEGKGVVLDIPFGEILAGRNAIVLGGSKLPDRLDWLYGFSQEGHRLALSEAVAEATPMSIPGTSRQVVRGSRLFYSKDDFDPTEAVTKVILEIKGFAEWLGISPIRTGFSVGEKTPFFSLEADLGRVGNQVLLEEGGLKIAVSHEIITNGSSELGYSVGHRCYLEIELEQPKELSDVEGLAYQVADFFSFCFGFHGEVVEALFRFGDASPACCLVPLVKGSSPKTIHAHRMVLPYREIRDDLSLLLAAWIEEGSDLCSPASLLTTLMTKNWVLPVDLKFIAAAQLLEALSRVGADLESMSGEDYEVCKHALKKALASIEDRHIAGLLSERVRVGNIKGQNRLLNELVKRHCSAARFVFGDPTAFIERHIRLRNGITHREGGLVTANEDLYWHTEAVLIFSYCVVGELLGVSDGKIERRMKESFYRYGSIQKCRELYPKKADESAGAE